jgi:hypothetical protein
MISAVPRALKRFKKAMRMWISAVGVSCGDALTKGLQAAHPLTGSRLRTNDERFRLDAAAGVVSRPALPECPSVVPRRAQGVVAGACGLSVFFARPPVL